ncbi:MAG: KOW domain-containing RNA-binding protein [Oscillospiraceae bacterium]|jgi:ribosomal protein L14E/L6E/L27E|nr:KOW domain-containing RNA-binding protein [Oscillospiraceae bacterium]
MLLEAGMLVQSRAGHDKGRFFAVIAVNENFALIADGKEHRLQSPKKKNPKHLAILTERADLANITDGGLRKLLHKYNYPNETNKSEE